jgi:DNA modification methylase
MKPVALVERALLLSSNRGDLVWEPFSGSGTSLVACEQAGRRCAAIELEPRHVQTAIERWERFTGRKAEKVEATS